MREITFKVLSTTGKPENIKESQIERLKSSLSGDPDTSGPKLEEGSRQLPRDGEKIRKGGGNV